MHIIIQGMSFGQNKLKGHRHHYCEHSQLYLLNVLIKCCNTKHLIGCTSTIHSILRSMNQIHYVTSCILSYNELFKIYFILSIKKTPFPGCWCGGSWPVRKFLHSYSGQNVNAAKPSVSRLQLLQVEQLRCENI